MSIPSDLRYTKSHEWVHPNDDGTATVGITQHAQELLGDMVFVETPQVGRELEQGPCAHALWRQPLLHEPLPPFLGTRGDLQEEVPRALAAAIEDVVARAAPWPGGRTP